MIGKAKRKIVFFALFHSAILFAENTGVRFLSQGEFQSLAEHLSKKVDLFQEVWRQDPNAEIYGGTARDFLYWVKGKFRDAKNVDDANRIADELRGTRVIAVRDFMMGESDADVITSRSFDLKISDFGLRKLDVISEASLDPKTEMGRNERLQGSIPVEKIRLGANGFSKNQEFGDGIGEIYRGKITAKFSRPEDFATGFFARRNENHPILLALRFVRQLAMNHFREQGRGYPNRELLLDIDRVSLESVKEAIASAMVPGALDEHFKQPRFVKWLNAAIDKAFRSYTNPTAAHILFKELGLDRFVEHNAGRVNPINQYLFAKYRDEAEIAKTRARFGVTREAHFEQASTVFPNGKLYHGTKTEEAFRGILFQGILPSANGTAGDGLYGVSERNIKFADDWGKSPERTVEFRVRPDAVIVDITEGGRGRALYDAFRSQFPKIGESDFAEAFGIDILKYDYHTEAYVVKNSSVLETPNGHRRKIMPFHELVQHIKALPDSEEGVLQLVEATSMNRLRKEEWGLIVELTAGRTHLQDFLKWKQKWVDEVEIELKNWGSKRDEFAREFENAITASYLANRVTQSKRSSMQRLRDSLNAMLQTYYDWTKELVSKRARRQQKNDNYGGRGAKPNLPNGIDVFEPIPESFLGKSPSDIFVEANRRMHFYRSHIYTWGVFAKKIQVYGSLATVVASIPAFFILPDRVSNLAVMSGIGGLFGLVHTAVMTPNDTVQAITWEPGYKKTANLLYGLSKEARSVERNNSLSAGRGGCFFGFSFLRPKSN